MKKSFAVALSAVAVLTFVGCSNDDDNNNNSDSTPTVTETETESSSPEPSTETIALVCPPPVGNVDIRTDANDQWAPGYVVGSDTILDPVAFGPITFTDTDTGEKHTEPAVTKTGASTEGAIECTFNFPVEDEVDETGETVNGTVEGTVLVTIRAAGSGAPTISSSPTATTRPTITATPTPTATR